MMSSSATTKHDLQPLLTTIDSPYKPSKLCKRTKIIILIIVLILGLLAVILITIFAIFGKQSSIITIYGKDSSIIRPGLIGLWPIYGGNLQNQQTTQLWSNSVINKENVEDISILCTYSSEGGLYFTGYVTIDDNNNAYFSDGTGYIISVNLDTCNEIWRQHIGILLGFDKTVSLLTRQSLTIFQDSKGVKGLLFGTPTIRSSTSNFPDSGGCFAVAVYLKNGSVWWSVVLGEPNNKNSFRCSSHGFTVDGKYAFGGFSQSGGYNLNNGATFIGKYFKIDIDSHQIVDIWYPFNYNLTNQLDENDKSYQGASCYNFPAIIDNYLVFGTSNLWQSPSYIDECLAYGTSSNFENYLAINDSNYIDICGQNKSDNKYWRCLEKDVYPSSLIILNKDTFKMEKGIVLQGADIYYGRCCKFDTNCNRFCPLDSGTGFNADLTAIATFKDKTGKLYAVGSQKSARLHVVEVPSGRTVVSRKYGPQSTTGQFGMAVDENNMIGITSINGADASGFNARYKLVNNITVCGGTGSILAFHLLTGHILWQIPNPYGHINDPLCFDDAIWDQYNDWTQLTDTNCNYGDFTNDDSDYNEYNDANVIIPPKWKNDSFLPLNIEQRAKFRAPVTIVNDIVFIPSDSGDIWVHDLFTGSFIHHFICPMDKLSNNQWNRPSIKGGISVVNDRVVFYCGGYFIAPNNAVNGNIFVSMKLNQ